MASNSSDEGTQLTEPIPKSKQTLKRLSAALDKISALDRLKDLASKGKGRSIEGEGASGSSSRTRVSLDMATKETNTHLKRNMKTKNLSSVTYIKGQPKQKKTRKTSKSPVFSVVAVVMLSNGIIKQRKDTHTATSDESGGDDDASTSEAESPEYQLPDQSQRFPTPLQIQRMVEQGLAVVDHKNGIEFNSQWTFEQVEDKLRALFPLIFDYFDGLPEDKNYDMSTPDLRRHTNKSRWVLCTKDRKAATIVPGTPFPTGSDIQFWSGGKQRTGFKEKVVLLTTRHIIQKRDLKHIKPFAMGSSPGKEVYESEDLNNWIDVNEPTFSDTEPGPSRQGKRKRTSSPEDDRSSDSNYTESCSTPPPTRQLKKHRTRAHGSLVSELSQLDVTETSASNFAETAIDLTSDINTRNAVPTPLASPNPPLRAQPKPLSLSSSLSFKVDHSVPNPWESSPFFHFN